MKTIKYLVVLVCMTLGLANVAEAQIFHNTNEVLYYISSSGKGMRMVRFDGNKVYIACDNTDDVKEDLRNNLKYYDEQIPIYIPDDKEIVRSKNDKKIIQVGLFDKDNLIPNSSKVVYIEFLTGASPTEVLAFSKDLSSLVVFSVNRDYKQTGNIYYYTKITKEDLFPKANPDDFDFLND